MLTFNDYQAKAEETAIYSRDAALIYTTLGLAGEAGEIANKVKKLIRDRDYQGNAVEVMLPSDEETIIRELGDVLWYVSAIATDLGVSLGYVAQLNYSKLRDRAERNQIGGSGDER